METPSKLNKNLTPMKFVIYCRKSTVDPKRQELSLDAQERELLEIAQREQLNVVEIFRESKSAKEPGRPIFNSMLKYLASGKADAILCWRVNRLTRNPIDGGQLQWLLQNSKIQCIRTSEKYHYPNDPTLLLAIESSRATDDILTLSKDVKRGNRQKFEQGGYPHNAPFGYVNNKATKALDVSEKEAPYVARVFELYVTERLTLKQIANTLYTEGLRTKGGNQVKKNQIHRFLQNRLYTGFTEDGEGVIRKGNHQAIISASLFDEAQEILHGKAHPRPNKYFYSAQGFLKCANCNCAVTVDTQKGIQYYYCTDGKGICDQKKKYMRSDYVDQILSELFEELKIDEELIEISAEAYKIKNTKKSQYNKSSLESLNTELDSLLEKELALTDGYSSKIIREEIYKIKIKDLGNKRTELEEQLKNVKNNTVSEVTLEQIKNVFTDCNKASKQYLLVGDEEKRNMLKKLLSNATIKDEKILSYQFLNPYSVIAKSSKNLNLDELLGYKDSNLDTQDQNLMSYH